MSLRARVFAAAAAVTLSVALAGCFDGDSRAGIGEVGAVLPNAPMRGMDGDQRMLSDLKGGPVVINVWASWCGPCRAEMASLERLSRAYPAQTLRVIGVSTDDDVNLAREYLRASGVTFANFHDADQNLERNVFDAKAIPLTLVVDAQGRIVQRVTGAREWDSAQSVGIIQAALGTPLAPAAR